MPRRNSGPKLYWRAKRGHWVIAWTDDCGRSRKLSTGTADRAEAETIFGEWLTLRRKPTGPSDPTEILVTDVLTDYAVERGPKVIGKETMAHAITALVRIYDGKTVADIPSVDYIKKRGRAAGTVRRELGVLVSAINHAHNRGKLTRVVPVELPEVPPSKERWLTREEAGKLIRASRFDPKARLYMPLLILIGLYTGRRKEAILSLRWSQVDLKTNQIDFDIEGRARTKKHRGRAPIPPQLIPHLRRARLRGSDLGPVLHISSRPIQNIKKGFAAASKRAGIEGATPHTLRHTAASWLLQNGGSIEEGARYLGMSEKTFRNVYGHHSPEWLRGAAEAIGRKNAR